MQNRKRNTDVQNRLLDSVGEGEGGMFRENSIETSILSRLKQITSPGWMHETSAQGWCKKKKKKEKKIKNGCTNLQIDQQWRSVPIPQHPLPDFLWSA